MIDSDAMGFLEPEEPTRIEKVAEGTLDSVRQVLRENRIASVAANAARLYPHFGNARDAVEVAFTLAALAEERIGDA